MDTLKFDFVVIGSGLAGTSAALLLSHYGSVAILSKEPPVKSNSYAAQGGIAAPLGPFDSPDLHVADTLSAGAGLCNQNVVKRLIAEAADYMRWLMNMGVSFDKRNGDTLSFGLEGAHSQPRVLHAGGDATGANVLKVLVEQVESHSQILTIYDAHVQSLVQENRIVYGAWIVASGKQQLILGNKATILATGGVGQLYDATTNPLGATGDGIALAYEAGAVIRNMEFVQFHPTALQMESNPKFLISEAVRGAGGFLIDNTGRRIMADHPQKDLAPRDQVARRIFGVQQQQKQVFLDGTEIDDFESKFPTIYANCLARGIDPKAQPIPITPAAHFAMGGVMTELNGSTTVPGLYAIGEVANTGVHGANRLASNSMLECVGMAHELARNLGESNALPKYSINSFHAPIVKKLEQENSNETRAETKVNLLQDIQQIMWKAAGIIRDRSTLNLGLQRLRALKAVNPESAVITTAQLIVQSALLRTESRGAHYRTDYPNTNNTDVHDTVICKDTTEITSVS